MAKGGLIDMEVKGFDELEKAIKELRLDFDKELKKAIRRAGKKVLEDARRNFARNYQQRTGKGLESIKLVVKERKDFLTAVITAGGGDAYYMPFLEFGTSHQEARPYLRPAIDDNRQGIVDDIKKELQKAIVRMERRAKR